MKKILITTLVVAFLVGCRNSGTTANQEQRLERSNRSYDPKLLQTDKLKEDLDFLFKTIEEVHPNMYAYINKKTYAPVKNEIYKQIDHAMSISEFYISIQPVVYCLKDSHTDIFRPSNFIMPQITESMREYGERLRKLVREDGSSKTNAQYIPAPRQEEYMSPYSCHFFPKHDACLMVINSFGMPNQIEQYAHEFQEAFKAIREKGITNLIIDIRENQGGCGLVGDELLKYLANRPFRQIEKIEQRLVLGFFELCEQHGLDISQVMKDEYGIDIEGLKAKGSYKPGIILAGQGKFKNPHEPSDRFKGATYLLVAKPTFSAASNFAAMVKYFEVGILIGQETGGKRDHYGQILPFQLPNSELRGQVSTAHFVTVGGQNDAGGVKPDYEVKQNSEDTAKDVDTVLQFTLNLIKNLSSESVQKTKEQDSPLRIVVSTAPTTVIHLVGSGKPF